MVENGLKGIEQNWKKKMKKKNGKILEKIEKKSKKVRKNM